MSETAIRLVAHHILLRHPRQNKFHAYPDRLPGSYPLCGDENRIPANPNEMEIPGSASGTCFACFCRLYNFNDREKA